MDCSIVPSRVSKLEFSMRKFTPLLGLDEINYRDMRSLLVRIKHINESMCTSTGHALVVDMRNFVYCFVFSVLLETATMAAPLRHPKIYLFKY